MTSKSFRFHPEARTELREAVRWYRERNVPIALEFRSAINEAVRSVAEFPQRWPTYLYRARRMVLRDSRFS